MATHPRLVAVGHIIYDIRDYVEEFPQPDRTARLRTPSKVSGGGSAANVAVNACKLGISAGVVGNIGTDRHGDFLLSDLRGFGVDTWQVKRIKGASGLSVILIDKNGEVEVIEDYGVADRRRPISRDCIASSEFLHMSGCALSHLEAASNHASRAGIPISFDPGRAASRMGEKKLFSVLRRTDYLIVNKREIRQLSGSDAIIPSCEWLSKKYGLTCIIKQGAGDVLIVGQGKEQRIPPFKVKPIDTIGAGDAFCAGFISGIMEGKPLAPAVKFANAVAAAKVLHQGAQSLPSRAFIRKRFGI